MAREEGLLIGEAGVDCQLLQLVSLGVDVGSSTTHLRLSRVDLVWTGKRYLPVGWTLLHESPIWRTPMRDQTRIDSAQVRRLVEEELQHAIPQPGRIDIGSVLLTGLALARHNARALAEALARQCGDFIAVCAGDDLEASLAAYGSGAVARSIGLDRPLLHLDIGGGTTKLARCQDGRVDGVAAVAAGARLALTGPHGSITHVEEPAARLLCDTESSAGAATALDAGELAKRMAVVVADLALGQAGVDRSVWLRTAPLPAGEPPGYVSFSGGVSEFIYHREERDFGDLGAALGAAIRKEFAGRGLEVLELRPGIRSTVLGATQQTVQVSGSTIYLSDDRLLPLRDVPLVAPELVLSGDRVDAAAVSRAVLAAFARRALSQAQAVGVVVRWRGPATYRRLERFCRGLHDAVSKADPHPSTLVLACDADVGGLLGAHLVEELEVGYPVLSLDGLDLREFDYLDIGVPLAFGSIPVVIKSLLFPAHAEGPEAASGARVESGPRLDP